MAVASQPEPSAATAVGVGTQDTPIHPHFPISLCSLLLFSQMVHVSGNSVKIGGAQIFSCIVMSDFLTALAGLLQQCWHNVIQACPRSTERCCKWAILLTSISCQCAMRDDMCT
jgi:hypothetical protein